MSAYQVDGTLSVSDDKRKLSRYIDSVIGFKTLKTVPRVGARDNLTAVISPSVHDDESKGYIATSLWFIPHTEQIYMCITSVKGAAKWIDITDMGEEAVGTTASNLGDGIGVYSDKLADDLRFKSIKGTSTVTVEQNATSITLSAPIPTSTTDLPEGDNLYYTDARVSAHPTVTNLVTQDSYRGTPYQTSMLIDTANSTRLLSIPTQADTSYLVEVRVIGRKVGEASKSAAYTFHTLFTREGEVLTMASQDKLDLESVNGWDATVFASGTNIALDVIGDAQVQWKTSVIVTSV